MKFSYKKKKRKSLNSCTCFRADIRWCRNDCRVLAASCTKLNMVAEVWSHIFRRVNWYLSLVSGPILPQSYTMRAGGWWKEFTRSANAQNSISLFRTTQQLFPPRKFTHQCGSTVFNHRKTDFTFIRLPNNPTTEQHHQKPSKCDTLLHFRLADATTQRRSERSKFKLRRCNRWAWQSQRSSSFCRRVQVACYKTFHVCNLLYSTSLSVYVMINT